MSRPTLQRATIVPDYPNFGEYQGDVYAMGYASASMKAIWNNIRAVDVLTERPDVDAGRIGVIGHSLGGHNAIFTALFEPRIRAIVSSCGFNAFPDYFRGDIAGWSHSGYMPRLRTRYGLDLHKVPFDFPELIGALAPRAFFTNSPLHDTNFAVEGVRVCLAAARPIYALLGEPDQLARHFSRCRTCFPVVLAPGRLRIPGPLSELKPLTAQRMDSLDEGTREARSGQRARSGLTAREFPVG